MKRVFAKMRKRELLFWITIYKNKVEQIPFRTVKEVRYGANENQILENRKLNLWHFEYGKWQRKFHRNIIKLLQKCIGLVFSDHSRTNFCPVRLFGSIWPFLSFSFRNLLGTPKIFEKPTQATEKKSKLDCSEWISNKSSLKRNSKNL